MTNLPFALVNMVKECTSELTESLGLGSYAEDLAAAKPNQQGVLAAIIGFTDPKMNGSLVVMATSDCLTKSHPNAAMGMPIVEQDVADWIGELANQLLGRLKNRVVRCGHGFSMNTPTVMAGSSIVLQSVKDQLSQDFYFSGGHGPIFLRLSAQIAPGTQFVETETKASATEGDTMFF